MTMRFLILAGLALALTACGATGSDAKRPKKTPVPIDRPAGDLPARPITLDKRGLGDVMGKNVAELKRMFGEPRIDVVEVYGRKLQFSGKPCILDAYLYPDGKNGQEVVTHIDARRSDGAEVDRAACVNALSRR
ncbi:MAG: hypothetical protein ABL928_02315 [Sphingorhabdus sp.]